ncbi:MAG: TRAM domain-containing protein, partial [bacterium]|nr:TRAM domain-containing protein [bacterium]
FTYKYSERPGTRACGLEGSIPEPEKLERLNRLIKLQQQITIESNQADIGKTFEVLVEKESKRSQGQFMGRNGGNKTVAVNSGRELKPGQIVKVKIEKATQATLIGEFIQ